MLTEPPCPVFATRLMWLQRNRLAHLLGFPRADSARFAAQFPDAAWLFLRRRDVHAQGISYWRAKATGRWHVLPTSDEPEPTPPYDFAGIDACVRELVMHDGLWSHFFALAGIVPTTVWYEDLLSDCTPIERYMARFGLSLPETYSNLKIQGDAHSERCLARYLDDLFRRSRGIAP
jgi:LPS sulfotransferase NodH